MTPSHALIQDLSGALNRTTADARGNMLRRLTDLFLTRAEALADDHIALFDLVMARLVGMVERHALIRLGLQLAAHPGAPLQTIALLGHSDDLAVAGPVLERSPRLGDDVLIAIAGSKSQGHLAAIAVRPRLSEGVTDVVVEHADLAVTRKVTANAGALFSAIGLGLVVGRAHGDEELAVLVASRSDVPDEVLAGLLRSATEAVRRRVARCDAPGVRTRYNQAMSALSRQRATPPASAPAAAPAVPGPSPASPDRLRLLCEKARLGRRGDVIDELAAITEVPVGTVRALVRQGSGQSLMMLCKAAGLAWPDAKGVLAATVGTAGDQRQTFDLYADLTPEAAQRAVRFIRLRKAPAPSGFRRLL
ncbi:DUF2336 domain-containing protein [Rhodoplanes serenus]|uniref:DUF2336 domain-containing protein n=1 Tax=Rhodoplanes serenus TaxID=200615 RepID=UPI00131D177A|nr:DUF2336 domain-containing protein [Rhodoplanes serenus]